MSAEPGRIEPRLGTFDAAMLVVSLVIGIGIFRTPAIVAGAAQSGALFFGAWILGGAVSLMGAFTYAEIGSRFPHAGGYYKVVADCYHPAFAFMLNWAQAIMQGAGAAGASTIFVLRRRRAGEEAGGPFHAPLYPLPPLVFMFCLGGVALRILVVETPLALGSIAIFLAGWPLFLLARRVSR